MKSIKKTSLNEKERVYKLKSAIIHGYEYTKTYYKMENGIPVKCENGDDSCLTMINIRKCGDKTEKKRAFIFSEGYVGLEKSYNKDGKKIKSVSKKDGFGVSYLIKYIENNSSNLVDDFHVIFISDKETSEKQAELYAQAIKDITTDSIEKTYMWSHSKAGLFTLRAFEKMKDSGDKKSEKVLKAAGYSFFGKADLFLDKVDGDYNTMLGISPSIIHTELKKLGYEMKDFELK